MNIGLITARINQNPIRFSNFNYYFTEIQINFLHMKDYCANAIALAEGELSQTIMDFYYKGDYVLIEGEYIVLEDKKQNGCLVMYITDIHPVDLIIQE